jgi:hypothetical protein
MQIDQLQDKLDLEGVSPRSYSFTDDDIGEVYRIAEINDMLGLGWEVYYSERGNKNSLLVFRTESEACDYFLDMILPDSTTRLR